MTSLMMYAFSIGIGIVFNLDFHKAHSISSFCQVLDENVKISLIFSKFCV